MHPMLYTAVRSVREGARIILMYYNQLDRLDITSKGRNDFVSQADIEAERAIFRGVNACLSRSWHPGRREWHEGRWRVHMGHRSLGRND